MGATIYDSTQENGSFVFFISFHIAKKHRQFTEAKTLISRADLPGSEAERKKWNW
jgi:hypothetical protein